MEQDSLSTGRTDDRLAIADVLHQHSRGLDRSDPALIRDCYWPEAELDYGVYKGPSQPFADLVVEALTSTYELTRHCISNTSFTFAGDWTRTESYVDANHLFPGGRASCASAAATWTCWKSVRASGASCTGRW